MALPRTLTAGELIDYLQGFDEDTPVYFTSDYGDICHTKQLLPVGDVVEATSGQVEESAYSHSGYEYVKEREMYDVDEDGYEVDEKYEPIAVIEC